MQRKHLLAIVAVGALLALAGCSTTTTPDTEQTATPVGVEQVNESTVSTYTFALEYDANTYECVAYQDESLVSGNGATGFSGMSCYEVGDEANASGTPPADVTAFERTVDNERHVCFTFETKNLVSGNGATGQGALSCVPLDSDGESAS